MSIAAYVRSIIDRMRMALRDDNFEEFCWLADRFDYYDQIFIEEIEDGLRHSEDLTELHSLIIDKDGLLVDLYYEAKDAKKNKYVRHIKGLLVWDLFTAHH